MHAIMNFRIMTKITLAFAVLAAITLGIGAVGYNGMGKIKDGGDEIYNNYFVSVINLTAAGAGIARLQILQKSHIIAPSDQAMRRYEAEMAEVRKKIDVSIAAFAETLDAGEETEAFNIFREKLAAALEVHDRIIMLSRTNDDDEADRISSTRFREMFDELDELYTVMLQTNIDGGKAFQASNRETFGGSKGYMVGATLGTALIIVAMWFFVRQTIAVQITGMTRVMSILAGGDRSVDIPAIGRGDEIGDMARAVVVFRENMIKSARIAERRHAERLEKEQRLEQATAERTRFFAAAGHDLRQPLHAISLYLPVLESRVKSNKNRDLIAAIGKSCDAMRALVDSLLDISRLDAGIVEPQIAPVPLVDIFDQLDVEFAPQAAAKSLELSVEPISGWVATDRALLLRMLRNILSNAIRYTRKGRVVLCAHRSGSRLVVEVRDSGIGIPEGEIAHIFEEFYQVDNPERDRSQGLGLGLAIIDRLASLLGHPVDVRSAPGRGTVFSLELPRADAPVPRDVDGDAPQPVDLSDRLGVLVEDDDAVREAAEFLLVDCGCEVIAATSGTAAIGRVAASGRVPDFIVADLRLRGQETGVEAVERIRRAVGAPVPAMIVTGDTHPARLREVTASGCVLLHKPLEAQRFREELEALLTGPREGVVKLKPASYANR